MKKIPTRLVLASMTVPCCLCLMAQETALIGFSEVKKFDPADMQEKPVELPQRNVETVTHVHDGKRMITMCRVTPEEPTAEPTPAPLPVVEPAPPAVSSDIVARQTRVLGLSASVTGEGQQARTYLRWTNGSRVYRALGPSD